MIDLGAELRRAISDREVSAALAAALEPVIEAAVGRALAARSEKLEPLSEILDVTVRAAAARLRSDVELRALGHQVGRRLFFRRGDVERLLSERRRLRGAR